MPVVVGVTFKKMEKVYYFNPSQLDVKRGDVVVVETSKGIESGEVVTDPIEIPHEKVQHPLRPILRKATQDDISRILTLKDKEEHAFMLCYEAIENNSLKMKLIDAKYSFDEKRVSFFFSSDSRIDFRDLVRSLANDLKTKVELRQIGARDEARLIGGYGTCGQTLCCSKFNITTEPITIKMAKEQDLSLNPEKISGCCNRLMCCLRYEFQGYTEFKKCVPRRGCRVSTPQGDGIVAGYSVPAAKVIVQTSETTRIEVPVGDVSECKNDRQGR